MGAEWRARIAARLSALRHRAEAARPDFARRFDRAAQGGEPGPAGLAALAHFGDALVIDADPRALTHMLADAPGNTPGVVPGDANGETLRSRRFVAHGDWSGALSRVADDAVFREMADLVALRERFADGRAHAVLLDRARHGERTLRNGIDLDGAEAIDRYMRHYLALVRAIERDGYRRLERGRDTGPMRPRSAEMRETEVCVALAADGTLLRFVGGRHRLAIAAKLGLPRIPVLVRGVHAEFLREQAERRALAPYEAFCAWLAGEAQKSRSE